MKSGESVEIPTERFERNVFVINPENPCGESRNDAPPCFIPLESIPADTGSFPLTLERRSTGQIYNLEFYSGIIGIKQKSDLSLMPLTGWYTRKR